LSYGIELRTPTGKVFFSSVSTTWNYVWSGIVPANTIVSGTFNALSLINEVIVQRSFINSPPDSQEAIIHTVSRSGNTLTASGGNVGTLIVILAR